MKKSVMVMRLVVGVLMAGGCGGSEVSSSGAEAQADTVNEDSTGNSGQENAWQEDAASDVQVNGDTDEANDAVISQDSAETSNTVQSANPNYINYSGEKYTWNNKQNKNLCFNITFYRTDCSVLVCNHTVGNTLHPADLRGFCYPLNAWR